MNFKTTITSVLATGALALSTAVSAATFDFAYQADNVPPFERGYASYSLTDDGITVTATGSDLSGNTDYFAYLDYGNAGLGVCKKLDANNQCDPNNDDNTTLGEVLHLSFDNEVTIKSLNFTNGDHIKNFVGTDGVVNQFNVKVDGVTSTYDLEALFTKSLTGTHFDFWLADQVEDSDQNQFYISGLTAVPAPAPLALLALGLLGLYGANRKKQA